MSKITLNNLDAEQVSVKFSALPHSSFFIIDQSSLGDDQKNFGSMAIFLKDSTNNVINIYNPDNHFNRAFSCRPWHEIVNNPNDVKVFPVDVEINYRRSK